VKHPISLRRNSTNSATGSTVNALSGTLILTALVDLVGATHDHARAVLLRGNRPPLRGRPGPGLPMGYRGGQHPDVKSQVKLVDSRPGYRVWGAAAVQSPTIVAAHPALVPWAAISLWLELLGVAGGVLAISGTVAWRQHRSAAATPSVWARRARRLNTADLARLFAEVDSIVQRALAAAAAASQAELVLDQA